MPGRAVLLSVALGVLLSACGATPGRTATTAPAALPAIGLTIDAPQDETVRAERAEGLLVADVLVRGHAQPGAFVRVSSGCEEAGCELSDEVDAAGAWSVRVRAQATPSKPYARVFAQLAAESAITLVKLRLPPTNAKAKRRKANSGRKARDDQASHGGGAVAPDPTTSATTPPLPPLPPATPSPARAPAAGGSGATSSLLLIGDSLGVGIQPYLAGELPGWSITSDARKNRFLAEGMERWRAERGSAAVNAFSLFTNDAPTNTSALEAAVRESVSAGCSVWSTIVRPPQGGASYARVNTLLQRLAGEFPGRVVIVPWAAAVAADRDLVSSDGVHATAAGYRERARLYAQAARSCV